MEYRKKKKKVYKCTYCGKEQNRPLSKGYCISCYQYFIMFGYSTWYPSQYGEMARVQAKNNKQYDFLICHECGKAFTKLQQHIWYAHNMTKTQYCDKWGLDHKINMTTKIYNKKMRDYAYKYNMDDQLREVGKETRFKKGKVPNYERSYQTKQRLAQNSFKSRG